MQTQHISILDYNHLFANCTREAVSAVVAVEVIADLQQMFEDVFLYGFRGSYGELDDKARETVFILVRDFKAVAKLFDIRKAGKTHSLEDLEDLLEEYTSEKMYILTVLDEMAFTSLYFKWQVEGTPTMKDRWNRLYCSYLWIKNLLINYIPKGTRV